MRSGRVRVNCTRCDWRSLRAVLGEDGCPRCGAEVRLAVPRDVAPRGLRDEKAVVHQRVCFWCDRPGTGRSPLLRDATRDAWYHRSCARPGARLYAPGEGLDDSPEPELRDVNYGSEDS